MHNTLLSSRLIPALIRTHFLILTIWQISFSGINLGTIHLVRETNDTLPSSLDYPRWLYLASLNFSKF